MTSEGRQAKHVERAVHLNGVIQPEQQHQRSRKHPENQPEPQSLVVAIVLNRRSGIWQHIPVLHYRRSGGTAAGAGDGRGKQSRTNRTCVAKTPG